jgi:hypothetical protein
MSSRHRAQKREREEEKVLKRKKERKLHESLEINGEVNILRGGKHFNFGYPFYMIPFSPHPSHPFSLPMSSTYSAYRG